MRTDRLTAPAKGRTFFRMVIAAAVSTVLIYGIVYVARMDIEGYADISAYAIALAESASASLAEELTVIGLAVLVITVRIALAALKNAPV